MSRVGVLTGILYLPNKSSSTISCVLVSCLGEGLWMIFAHVGAFSSHTFVKGRCKFFVVYLIYSFTIKHPLMWSIPWMLKSTIIMVLNFNLLIHAIFCLYKLELFGCRYWRLVSGLYVINHDLSWSTARSLEFPFDQQWRFRYKLWAHLVHV